jgi:hypothetical protein
MKTIILAAIRCSLMFTVTWLFSVQPARAYTVTLEQVGSNVVATGSGAIDLTGLTLEGGIFLQAALFPHSGIISMGPTAPTFADQYGGMSGPTSFGSGSVTFASSGSGDAVAIEDGTTLFVLQSYLSGTALSDSDTFNNATFAGLGVTPGTYVWTWGTGLPNQNFTLVIGAAGVPDGGSTVSLLGFALVGLAGLRRKLGC